MKLNITSVVLLILLSACSEQRCKNLYTAPGINTVCHGRGGANCGSYLFNCENGKEYLCVQSVQKETACR